MQVDAGFAVNPADHDQLVMEAWEAFEFAVAEMRELTSENEKAHG